MGTKAAHFDQWIARRFAAGPGKGIDKRLVGIDKRLEIH
jgi:hypothetical protein